LNRFLQQAKEKCKQKYNPFIERYFEEIQAIREEYSLYMVNASVRSILKKTNSWKENWSAASNLLTQRTSRLANHKDPPSILPAVLSCINPLEVTRPWIHGELLLSHGSFLVNYNKADVLLIFGDKRHAVMPITPDPGVKNACRHSMVHFSRWTLSTITADTDSQLALDESNRSRKKARLI
jgi:hypothetical protein